MNKAKKNWLFAFGLTVPLIILYLAHYLNHDISLIPTGFIGYDNVSYIAYAKEYLDQDNFSFFYSNPFNDSAGYPKIYFQPQTIIYAFLLTIGLDPGFVIVFFNCLGTFLSFRMIINIYDHLYPQKKHRKLLIIFFCWGGGLLGLAGIPIALFYPTGNSDFLTRIFFIDPAWGWWGLNFGRGHIISSEGYYHFLFLSGICTILKRKWLLSLFIAFILSASHPFTGIEYLAIATVWAGTEKILIKSKDMPWHFLLGVFTILMFHLFYYIYYLNQFADHQAVSEQYSLNWRLRFFNMIPAYCLVGGLAFFYFWQHKRDFFKQVHTRLFFCWFIISFSLANHEIFMKPMQPLHFTRGYIWASLFLLGLPTLQSIFNYQRVKKHKFAMTFFCCLMLSDNFLWILNYVRDPITHQITHISIEQRKILSILNSKTDSRSLIISRDAVIPYLSNVYTKSYSWFSHPFTTPYYTYKSTAYNLFLTVGTVDPKWAERNLVFVFKKSNGAEMERLKKLPFTYSILFNGDQYIVLSKKANVTVSK